MKKTEQRYTGPRSGSERQDARRTRYRQRRRNIFLIRLIVILILLLIVAIAAFFITSTVSGDGFHPEQQLKTMGEFFTSVFHVGGSDSGREPAADPAVSPAPQTEAATAEPETKAAVQILTEAPAADVSSAEITGILEEAALLAAGYDYSGAISLLKTVPDYKSNTEVMQAIKSYKRTKKSCVAVDVNTVPHIFYHSLLNDTDRAFNVSTLGQFAVDGMNAWMTTIDEFDKITRALYDAGYVYVRLRDLVVETKNADGTSHFEPNTSLMLPPGKKAIVLSIDDLSYYHSYETAGFPEKLVLDENGLVKCKYTDAGGNTQIGDFDVVPRLNTFLREHPDGSYKGARGLIAMTGYNGVFGYRTDADYELREHLMEDQSAWLAAHPDYDRQTEIAEAIKIADAIKNEGWEFASHTWGHLSVTGASVERLRTDNEKWVANVQNIVGPVDTIIFAHGNDIGSWEGYSDDNEQYAFYKSAGYNFYCNVDGSVPYWVQITSNYVRQGRIDLDGYMLYEASIGNTSVLDNLFKASEVFDSRRPTPVVANGQG